MTKLGALLSLNLFVGIWENPDSKLKQQPLRVYY